MSNGDGNVFRIFRSRQDRKGQAEIHLDKPREEPVIGADKLREDLHGVLKDVKRMALLVSEMADRLKDGKETAEALNSRMSDLEKKVSELKGPRNFQSQVPLPAVYIERMKRECDADVVDPPLRGVCEVKGCSKPWAARKVCKNHYNRAYSMRTSDNLRQEKAND